MENTLQHLATDLAPLYQRLTPDAYNNMTAFSNQAKVSRQQANVCNRRITRNVPARARPGIEKVVVAVVVVLGEEEECGIDKKLRSIRI